MSKTIENGNSVDIAVQPTHSLKVAWLGGTYSAQIVAGAANLPVALATSSQANQTFGPYANGAVIRVSVSPVGRVAWDAGVSQAFRPSGEMFTRADDGVTVALQGIDSSAAFAPWGSGGGGTGLTTAQTTAGSTGVLGSNATGTALTKPDGTLFKAAVTPAKGTISLAGDSTVQRGFNGAAGVAGGLIASTNIHAWAASQLGSDLTILNNYAVGGTTTLDLVNSQLASLVADPCSIAVIHSGVNNTSATIATARTIAQSFSDMRTILNALSPVKQLVVVDSVQPLVGGTFRATNIRRLNEGFAQICQEYPNVIFNDLYDAIFDSTSLTESANTNYLYDQVHQNTWGAKRMGYQWAKNIRDKVRLLPAYNVLSSPAAFVPTGTGATTAGTGVTYAGDSPWGNMTVQGIGNASTWTLTKRVNTAPGNPALEPRLRIVCPTIPSGSSALVVSNTTATAAYAANFANGDLVRPYFEITMNSQVGICRGQAEMGFNGTVRSTGFTLASDDPQATTLWPAETFTARFYGQPYLLTATPTAMSLQLTLFWKAAGGSIDIEIANMGVEKVSLA